MDIDQFTGDLSGLTRMAVASHERLAELTGRVNTLRERLQKLLVDAEPEEQPGKSPPDSL